MRVNREDLPAFADFPLQVDEPKYSAWSVWGAHDELGTLNLLTSERVQAASRLVQRGEVFPLNWNLELPDPPLFKREPMRHIIRNKRPWANEDIYQDFNTQSSSHWDGLSHWGCTCYHNTFYQGARQEESTGREGTRNGIQTWARRGIVGRGILLDYVRWAQQQQISYSPGSNHLITVAEIEAMAQEQEITFQTGDILLIRSGWIAWYLSLSPDKREAFAVNPPYQAVGVSQGEETLRFLWDQHFAAVASDTISFEAWPPQSSDDTLHNVLLPLWGMPIGEMFFLEDLATACASDKRYEFFLTSAPLNKLGGVASPPNCLAIR